MQKSLKYTIFKTKWGYFGLAGMTRLSSTLRLRPEGSSPKSEYALWRTCLPLPDPEKVKSHLLKNLSLLNRESSIKHSVCTQMSLRAKRSNLAASRYEIATACKTGLAMTHDHQVTGIEFDRNLFRQLQEQITAYFEGTCVDFSRDVPIVLDGFGSFTYSVLTACRDIKFGQRISYSALAKRLDRPTPHQLSGGDGTRLGGGHKDRYGYNWCGARAVGNALAKNPVPLIIPCHRVIRSDGKVGGFSAPGGKGLKSKLLKHEQAVLIDFESI